MKVHLDNVRFGTTHGATGPNTFATRLARRLFESGHEVTTTGRSADVSLVFIEPSGAELAPVIVQRLDGIWFKPADFEAKNCAIKDTYGRASGVVFQSQFDKQMVETWWGSNDERQRPCEVIGNGVELRRVEEITIPALADIRARYEHVFVCSNSSWHPQKRLASNVRLFYHLRETRPNSCLVIVGGTPDVQVADPHVFYTGLVGHDVYMQVYAVADWMLHLAWADHCPNVVVEALSQGTPVVCSEAGGTKELIGHGAYGMVVKEREPYRFQLYDYDDPPAVDVEQVTFLPTRHELDYSGIPSIDINVVAAQYVQLFERLVRR